MVSLQSIKLCRAAISWVSVLVVLLTRDGQPILYLNSLSSDMTATCLAIILCNMLHASIDHSLLLKHFQTFHYDSMQPEGYTKSCR